MRPLANFTVHAILAAAIAALATASAAAWQEEAYFTITLLDAPGAAPDQGQRLEVQSYRWGSDSSAIKLEPVRITSYQLGGSGVDSSSGGVAKVDGFAVKQKAKPADPGQHGNWLADVERPHARGTGRNELKLDDTAGKEKSASGSGRATTDMVMKGSSIGENSSSGTTVGASQTVSVGGSRTESGRPAGRVTGIASDPADPASGQATGKRQHKPLLTRGYYDQSAPPERGILTVLAGGVACRVGARFPSLALSGRGRTYLLHDVEVAACNGASGGAEEIGFVYGKVQVRGWDPKTRQK